MCEDYLTLHVAAAVFILMLHMSELAHAYFINIDANEEQCFFDRVTAGTKMGLTFEVAEGGFLDIDFKVSFLYSCKRQRINKLSLTRFICR